MARIEPFRAYRPRPEVAARVAALPYDVYNRAEARVETEREPLSFLNIDRPETQFAPEQDMYAPEVYRKAHDLLWNRVEEGIFLQEDRPCYYLYEQEMDGRLQTGVVAVASVDDYLYGVVKKHENTLEAKEQDRIRHVDACDMQTGPIFLCYREDAVIRGIIDRTKQEQAPLYDFRTQQDIGSRVWRVDRDADVEVLRERFAGMPAVYIADGHHRCASAVKVALKRREKAGDGYDAGAPYNFFLSVLFPDQELMIMDYNRVVRDLNGLTPEAFLAALDHGFAAEPSGEPVHPAHKGEMGLYLDGQWYRLQARQEICPDDAVEGLDVSILQNEVLSPILNITDPKRDPRIDFIGGIRGLGELEKRCDTEGWAAAFAMFPTGIHELFRVADEGRLMPPKSTWFEPKLLSGLFLHALK